MIARLLLSCAAVMVLAATFAADFSEQEPNNSFPSGPPIGTLQSGDRIVGTISPALDVDYLLFRTAGTGQPGWYRFTFRAEGIPSAGDSLMTLYDGITDAFILCFNDDFVQGVDLTSQCGFDMYWDGTDILWCVLIEGFDSADVWPYAIRVTYAPIQVNQGPTITPGQVVFDTSGDGTIADTVLSLFDAQGNFIAYDDDSGSGFRAKLTRSLAAGTYYVAVSTFETWPPDTGQPRQGLGLGTGDEGTYTLTVKGIPFTGSISRGTAAWYKVEVQNPTKQVAGRVLMDHFIGDPRMWPVTFELREPGTLNVLETHVVPLDIDGFYSFTTERSGQVDVAAKSAQWLRVVQPLDLSGTTSGFDWLLPGGDANGDNFVDLMDLNIALLNFTKEGPYTPGDVDGNSQVDLPDLNLILLRWNTRGDD
ncbi:MAG: hypothetical protein AMXMBFR61_15220 [Fimbriimonadales bacterium]